MSRSKDSSVIPDKTSSRNDSLSLSRQTGVGPGVGRGVIVGWGSIGEDVGSRVLGGREGLWVRIGASVGLAVIVG
jgi:hypothetical protein